MLIHLRQHRALARATSCEDNLKNLALALHNYHSAYKQFPPGAGGTDFRDDTQSWQNNQDRLSAFVGLLPFMEEQPLWVKISNPFQSGSIRFPAMGPSPQYDADVYAPWKQRPNRLVCTSENESQRFPLASSYVLNYGDGIDQVGSVIPNRIALRIIGRASKRGVFARKQVLRFRDILDGTSNTLLFSEKKMGGDQVAKDVQGLVLNPSLCIEAQESPDRQFWPNGRSAVWADGTLLSAGFQAILPPNSSSCTSDHGATEGVLSASSHHSDGVHVAFVDGRVNFISDSIDAGDSRAPSVAFAREGTRGATPPGSQSPYGLWGSLGTRASREKVDRENVAILPPQKELSPQQKKDLLSKPAYVWTAADGKNKLSARQINLHMQSKVVLMTDDGKQKSVPLSSLKSEDAYRAVAQHLAVKIEARRALKEQLQAGLKLLDEKQCEAFAAKFVVGAELDPKSMGRFVKSQRGTMIQLFESSLAAIELPAGSPNVKMIEPPNGPISVQINLGGRNVMPRRLQLQYIEGRWKLGR